LHKNNRRVEKEMLQKNPTPSMINREAAKVDNATPGPGLRKGAIKHDRSSLPSNTRRSGGTGAEAGERDNQAEETGWGGLPFPQKQTRTSSIQDDAGPSTATRQEDLVVSDPTAISEAAIEVPTCAGDTEVPEKAADQTDESAISPVASSDNPPLTERTVPQRHRVDNFTTDYYFHAQQAFIVAAVGGLAGALEADQGEDSTPSPVGRSLFFALNITTWEADADDILELGWAAVWYQEKLDKDKAEECGFEEMRDAGHYVCVSVSFKGCSILMYCTASRITC